MLNSIMRIPVLPQLVTLSIVIAVASARALWSLEHGTIPRNQLADPQSAMKPTLRVSGANPKQALFEASIKLSAYADAQVFVNGVLKEKVDPGSTATVTVAVEKGDVVGILAEKTSDKAAILATIVWNGKTYRSDTAHYRTRADEFISWPADQKTHWNQRVDKSNKELKQAFCKWDKADEVDIDAKKFDNKARFIWKLVSQGKRKNKKTLPAHTVHFRHVIGGDNCGGSKENGRNTSGGEGDDDDEDDDKDEKKKNKTKSGKKSRSDDGDEDDDKNKSNKNKPDKDDDDDEKDEKTKNKSDKDDGDEDDDKNEKKNKTKSGKKSSSDDDDDGKEKSDKKSGMDDGDDDEDDSNKGKKKNKAQSGKKSGSGNNDNDDDDKKKSILKYFGDDDGNEEGNRGKKDSSDDAGKDGGEKGGEQKDSEKKAKKSSDGSEKKPKGRIPTRKETDDSVEVPKTKEESFNGQSDSGELPKSCKCKISSSKGGQCYDMVNVNEREGECNPRPCDARYECAEDGVTRCIMRKTHEKVVMVRPRVCKMVMSETEMLMPYNI